MTSDNKHGFGRRMESQSDGTVPSCDAERVRFYEADLGTRPKAIHGVQKGTYR
jgi:hypothetical protein